jgi:Ca2+-transporting ATPase
VENLVLGGLFAIEDAVRPEAVQAVKMATQAGVRVVMITGDHKQTAKAIAKEAGIYHEGSRIITGGELAELDARGLARQLDSVSVFARVTPEDKMKIIEAYKHKNLIVAMTGDGVNDAPSLVAADLGVGMGKIGTEVAKEASDIVLLDDNLKSIVAAIEEGRNMYRTIQKALIFLFSTSLGELFALVGALLLNWPLPILAAQILWLNLITDPLIGSALAVSKKDEHLLAEKPTALPKYFFDSATLVQTFLFGVTMAAVGLYLFNLYLPSGYEKAVTVTLTILAVSQWLRGLSCTSLSETIFRRQTLLNYPIWLAVVGNFGLQLLAVYHPLMQKVLKTTSLGVQDWLLIWALSFSVILVDEARKLVFRKRKKG